MGGQMVVFFCCCFVVYIFVEKFGIILGNVEFCCLGMLNILVDWWYFVLIFLVVECGVKKGEMGMKIFISVCVVVVIVVGLVGVVVVQDDMIKIGVLYLLFGIMVILEIMLKDIVLMMVDQQNVKGGLLGKKIEVVVVDFVLDWLLFVEKVCELILVNGVDVIFGCWISVSCKFVLLVIEELNGLLFYFVQYEGEELFKNVIYIGVVLNQQVILVVDYMMEELGVEKWVLLGIDYVYLCIMNNILDVYLKGKGVVVGDIFVNYILFGYFDWFKIVVDVVVLGVDGKKVGVVLIINGDVNIGFYKELVVVGVLVDDILVMVFLVGEEELVGLDIVNFVGYFVVWNYFESVDMFENKVFIDQWYVFIKNDKCVINDLMEVMMIGFNVWVVVVEKVGLIDIDVVLGLIVGVEVLNLIGGMVKVLLNYYLIKFVLIGEICVDGQFDIISQIEEVVGDVWIDFLLDSVKLDVDWLGK